MILFILQDPVSALTSKPIQKKSLSGFGRPDLLSHMVIGTCLEQYNFLRNYNPLEKMYFNHSRHQGVHHEIGGF
jgi:hypothetical protein